MFYTMHLPGTVWSHDCAIECAFYVLLPRHHCTSTDNLQHCLTFSWASSRILLKAEASNSTRTSRNKCFLGVTRRKTPTIRKANACTISICHTSTKRPILKQCKLHKLRRVLLVHFPMISSVTPWMPEVCKAVPICRAWTGFGQLCQLRSGFVGCIRCVSCVSSRQEDIDDISWYRKFRIVSYLSNMFDPSVSSDI